MATVWEIAAGVEFAKSTQLDDHRTSTDLTVKTGWLILDLDFFHFRLSFSHFLFKRLVKLVNDPLPLFFSNFYIIQFCFHFSCKFHIYDIWEEFDNQRIDYFTQFCRFKALGNQFNIVAFLNGFNGRCIGRWTTNAIFFQSLDERCFRIASWRLGKVLFWIGIDTLDGITFFHVRQHFILVRVIIDSQISIKLDLTAVSCKLDTVLL